MEGGLDNAAREVDTERFNLEKQYKKGGNIEPVFLKDI